IRWYPPTKHYKLTINGAYDKNNQITGTGGIIRDHNGNWIVGFAHKADATDALHAELPALMAGIELSFTKNLFPTVVETDSQVLCNLFKTNNFATHIFFMTAVFFLRLLE
ncbi:hypothetical protein A4A49_60474, partial [Nicotiana attenuata]